MEEKHITQSPYFQPDLNTAIFDGPLRFYFSQAQEGQALRIYFQLQERFDSWRRQIREALMKEKRQVFVVLYPTERGFQAAGGKQEQMLLRADFGPHPLLAISPSITDEKEAEVLESLEEILSKYILPA